MLKQLYEIIRSAFLLTHDLQENRREIEEIRRELAQVEDKLHQIALMLQEERNAREKIALQMEIHFCEWNGGCPRRGRPSASGRIEEFASLAAGGRCGQSRRPLSNGSVLVRARLPMNPMVFRARFKAAEKRSTPKAGAGTTGLEVAKRRGARCFSATLDTLNRNLGAWVHWQPLPTVEDCGAFWIQGSDHRHQQIQNLLSNRGIDCPLASRQPAQGVFGGGASWLVSASVPPVALAILHSAFSRV